MNSDFPSESTQLTAETRPLELAQKKI